ncbi:MAG: LON peptidase substrate-binding domain-containing protein [Chloroflexota bacterium]|nr:LON peptidase substrate-binding domain-containing protein [Chloroflexota bacterium]
MPVMQLPYFPLHTVVFPHLPLPVHVFEDRYRAMATDLMADGSPYAGRFVVSMIVDGPEVGGDAATRPIGTICEVRTAEQFPDGRWVLLAVGVGRARLGAIDRSGPYALIEVQPVDEPLGTNASALVAPAQRALDAYMATVKRFVVRTASVGDESQETTDVAASLDQVLKPIQLPDDPVAASYAIGGVLQIELSRKQHLLELPDAATRLRAELDLLRRESRLLDDGSLPPIQASDIGYNPN